VPYKQITYSDTTHTFRLTFPDDWAPATIDYVNIQLADEAGTELLAATACDLWTAAAGGAHTLTALASAVSAGDMYWPIGSSRVAPESGDVLEVADSDSGPPGRRTVDYYDSANKYVYLTMESGAHANSTTLRGCFASEVADISDSDDFADGAIVVATWSPYDTSDTLVYPPIKEMYQVGSMETGIVGFWESFRAVFPAEYKVVCERDPAAYQDLMQEEFKARLWAIEKQADRVVNQRQLDEGLRLYTRLSIIESQGDSSEYEQKVAMAAWERWYNETREAAMWQDKDLDDAIDPEEVAPSVPVFDNGYF